jgi:hypothetical protein
MSVDKFKFVSPGVFINEIDNSQLPNVSQQVGPVVIGRLERGPGLVPVKVQSFSEFIDIFGNPIPGGAGGDAWRDGNKSAPTYAAYAAQAWLRNNSPLTVIRLLGAQHTDAIASGFAGWETKDSLGNSNPVGSTDADGGAYGLFIIDSGSTDVLNGINATPATGTLAAVFYINEGSIVLTGSSRGSGTVSGTAALVASVGADKEFRAIIRDANSNVVKTTTFNFNVNSKKYIRKVFNTNPVLTNPSVSTGQNAVSYWLGETYERFLSETCTASTQYGVILGLKGDGASREGSDHRMGTQPAKTGWIFSQDLQVVSGTVNSFQPENMTKLFRFVGLNTGEWDQSNLKISIQDIKASTNPADPYGTFTVVIRKVEDSDNAIQVVERFSSCNLNPYSARYIAKKIGDRYVEWDDTNRRYREFGEYDNKSKFVRVEMNFDVNAGAINPVSLPFGFYGPVRHKGFAVISGSLVQPFGTSNSGSAFAQVFIKGATDQIVRASSRAILNSLEVDLGAGSNSYTGSFLFPTIPLRTLGTAGNLPNVKRAYWGVDTSLNSSTVRFNPGYCDLVRALPAGYDSFSPDGVRTEYSFIFTLDNISGSGNNVVYASGSRAAGTSVTAQSVDNYSAILQAGHDKFTMPLFGGFDGLDIAEKEPFNNTDMDGNTELTSYAFNSVKRAIDIVSDPEVVEMNLACVPGVTVTALTDHLIKVCEDRGDALAIVDLEGGYLPPSENTEGDDSVTNRGDVDTTVSNLRDRGINSSYACAYYPWVQINDTINGATLFAPPSVVALGVLSYSERNSELWFAPAGFTRGGLSEGSAGIPVIGVKEKLTSEDRDKLYEANINPIGTFPAQGIVIFGQKTLQVTPSALDRINVRRLLIFLKKEVSKMAATVLFDQNVKVTWNRFLGKVKPFLESVQTRLGLTDFKVVLDETTTTPELIDRNVMYAKIFLKPAKAIEFIAIDFVITDSGASFQD